MMMEVLNGVQSLSLLKDKNGVGYLEFRRNLSPLYYKVWFDMALCILMMCLPFCFLKVVVNELFLANIFIPVCALWTAYWIHAYSCFFHEAAHFNIHTNKTTNDLISNILLTPFSGMLVGSYRYSHWEHHKHLGTIKDTEISYKSSLSISNLLQVITGLYHIRVILKYVQNFKASGPQAKKNSRSVKFFLSLLYAITCQIMIAYILFILVGIAAGLSWIIAYFVLFPMLARIRQTLEHRMLDSPTYKNKEALRCQAVNRLFGTDFFSRYFGAAGFNRHLLHHCDPTISYTNFDELELFLKNTTVSNEFDIWRSTYLVIFFNLLER